MELKMNLLRSQKDKFAEARKAIWSFNWANTTQGGDYWKEVNKQLEALAILASTPQVTYIEPTDEHAKSRPMVEVKNSAADQWIPMRLVYVADGIKSQKFKVTNGKGFNVFSYRFCRMKVED